MSDTPRTDVIQKAWEDYHGPIIDEGGEEYIPAMPPAFMRGFVDGFQHARRESISVGTTTDQLREENGGPLCK